jgi:hypothetical protein
MDTPASSPPSPPAPPAARLPNVDPLFFATVNVTTFSGSRSLTNASGFFFERERRLYLVTSRHVLIDAATDHHPDRIEIVLHLDAQDLTRCAVFSMPLYQKGTAAWHQGQDSGGEVDVAVLPVDRRAWPAGALWHAFTPAHLPPSYNAVPVDATLCIPGFPLGFGDTVHQLPVLRHAAIASPYGIRFQGRGFFLTDARTHRGTSGAPVVMRQADAQGLGHSALPWRLLGVHSARMDMGNRDRTQDESLGLNCAWYADILLALTR